MQPALLSQGAEIVPAGVRYCVWAPEHERVAVEICDGAGNPLRTVPLFRDTECYHHATDIAGRAGDLYRYKLTSGSFPCPASRWQPLGIEGPSMVIDPCEYRWRDKNWQRPNFRDLILYELHVGTFTEEGTFRATIEKLPYLRELGVTCIELMPVADFPGEHNWGYDGVRLFAPARAYGHPDDLRALVDTAHGLGLAVILDVVYNHFGPAGNYLREFSRFYFETKHETPWGDAINFGGDESDAVRAYFLDNIEYWMDEFHIDGFRLDATHTIFDDSPTHILQEIADTVRERGGYVIAEDERNESRLINDPADGGFGLNACWADDFHHALEVAVIEASIYKDEYAGELHELTDLLQHGWAYRGRLYKKRGEIRGTNCDHLPPERFVFCISNHDQVGNRAFGDRIGHLVSAQTYRAASALLCLSPYTPLLFMGQEWNASAPFLYFTDHENELGRLVEEGRRREFSWMFEHARNQGRAEEPPNPQDEQTFLRSKLAWKEQAQHQHAHTLLLYRALLNLRRQHSAFRPSSRHGITIAELSFGVLAIRLRSETEEWLVLCNLRGDHRGSLAQETAVSPKPGREWAAVLSTEEVRFGGSGTAAFHPETNEVSFHGPEVLILRAT